MTNLIIWDWDDTMCPTSWILDRGINLSKSADVTKYLIFFAKLDLVLYKIMNQLLQMGDVYIVTNATMKWIKASSDVLPNVQRMLQTKIPVISAREKWSKLYPDNNTIWKENVFEELSSNKDYNQILSFGDAYHEFKALVNLFNHETILKSIRFKSTPSYNELVSELEIIAERIIDIMSYPRNLDISMYS